MSLFSCTLEPEECSNIILRNPVAIAVRKPQIILRIYVAAFRIFQPWCSGILGVHGEINSGE